MHPPGRTIERLPEERVHEGGVVRHPSGILGPEVVSLVGGSARPRATQAGDGPQALGLRASVQEADVGGVFQFHDDVLSGTCGQVTWAVGTSEMMATTVRGHQEDPSMRAARPCLGPSDLGEVASLD